MEIWVKSILRSSHFTTSKYYVLCETLRVPVFVFSGCSTHKGFISWVIRKIRKTNKKVSKIPNLIDLCTCENFNQHLSENLDIVRPIVESQNTSVNI